MTVESSSTLRHSANHDAACSSCTLLASSLCSAIGDDGLHHLASVAIAGFVGPGRILIDEGAPVEDFYNITAGAARLFKMLPDGRRQIIRFAGVGYFLGLVGSDTHAFSAEAIGTLRYCRFPRRGLHDLMEDFPALVERLMAFAAHELALAQEQMLLLGRKTARERLASFLEARCLEASSGMRRRQRLSLPMTRGDIADYLGLTIETVSRTLSLLKAAGIIAIPSCAEIVILDPSGLAALAGGAD
jgi:CRP/FNR family transcriptional regulator